MWHTSSRQRDEEADAAGDDALAAAACADPQAFAPLYQRYVGAVYRYCYLRLGERTAAEDATGEVFIKALAALPGYRSGHFSAWLFRIAHNVVADAYRRARPATPLDLSAERPDTATTPEDQALAQERLDALRIALAALTEAQRQAVELHLAGCSVAQSAAALGTSPGALKLLRFRALRRLRTLLAAAGWDNVAEVSHDRT